MDQQASQIHSRVWSSAVQGQLGYGERTAGCNDQEHSAGVKHTGDQDQETGDILR